MKKSISLLPTLSLAFTLFAISGCGSSGGGSGSSDSTDNNQSSDNSSTENDLLTTNYVWSFVDGNGTNGINYNAAKNADVPQLTVFNGELYATWQEKGDSWNQYSIRVARYDNISNWEFVDDNATFRPDYAHQTSNYNSSPQLTVFNDELHATWLPAREIIIPPIPVPMPFYFVAVTKYDNASNWESVDGTTGLVGHLEGENRHEHAREENSQLTVFNDELYTIWAGSAAESKKIVVAKYDGAN